jgi:hypothetical protein
MEWIMPHSYDYHCIDCDSLTLNISTRTKKDIEHGRICNWNVYMWIKNVNYGYVQINNQFIGTLDDAKQYAEQQLRKFKEGIPS